MSDCVAIAAELPFRQQVSPDCHFVNMERFLGRWRWLTRVQVSELALHLSRSLPTSADPASAQREFVASFESQLPGGSASAASAAEGEAESSAAAPAEETIDEETKKKVVRALVAQVGELRGALEATRETGQSGKNRERVCGRDADRRTESESAHLLLQHLVASTFEGEEFEELERKIVDAVQKGAEANAASGRMTRVDAACRMCVCSAGRRC